MCCPPFPRASLRPRLPAPAPPPPHLERRKCSLPRRLSPQDRRRPQWPPRAAAQGTARAFCWSIPPARPAFFRLRCVAPPGGVRRSIESDQRARTKARATDGGGKREPTNGRFSRSLCAEGIPAAKPGVPIHHTKPSDAVIRHRKKRSEGKKRCVRACRRRTFGYRSMRGRVDGRRVGGRGTMTASGTRAAVTRRSLISESHDRPHREPKRLS